MMTDTALGKHRFFGMPTSWVGWTSLGIAALAVATIFTRRWVGGFRGVFAAWAVAGAVALTAVVWKEERSFLVWIPLVIGALAALWGPPSSHSRTRAA